MAIDISQRPQTRSEVHEKLLLLKRNIENKCGVFWQVARKWMKRNWKILSFILFGMLVSLHVFSECDNKNKQRNDVSMSIVAMEPLLQIEQKLVQALDKYANDLQRKVDTIRSGLSKMRRSDEIQNIDAEHFLGNPFNSFPMLRRLKTEWKAWEMFLKKSVGKDHIDSIHDIISDLSDYDLFESIKSIEILRKVYEIHPDDWVEGKLHRDKYNLKFSTLDAYSVGFLLFKKGNYNAADEWFLAALKAYEECDMHSFLSYNRSFIYESYVENLLKQNRTELALMVTDAALKMDMHNDRLLQKRQDIQMLNLTILESPELSNESWLDDSIKRGCRGDYIFNTSSQLHCYYNWTVNDFVRLAPFKVEEVFLDPILLMYHDIVNEDEIVEMKDIAKHQLKRFAFGADSKDLSSSYQTLANVYIYDGESRHVSHLNRRIEDITGLQTGDEPLLVENYGPGAFYEEHTDCLYEYCDNLNITNCDRRYMTVLVYLADVESGGATIFPRLEISIAPQKGTALIWYNLKNDMEQWDLRTLHMICPVIVGSNWIATKYIYFKKQAFRRPCYKNTSDVFESKL